ncbi:rhamnan synthesis F family protein [Pseudotabrizicola alkalilacus]|uniref:Rhamnan synthesis protein F family n=1 Tax=Pseudotabrizicola alkalilacus TaxID=2305252 RepID=A0A411Z2A9_9RHOB|nr:rhamnan synthesis F family protein [Pseudotabrizicola alkalilacus]RGP37211.1 rhamnan synthesis protein F family [Pseudotabrizicola alkalilacus]
MIPAWKVRREMLRFWRQITGLPGQIAAVPSKLMQRRQRATYDRDFDQLVQITTGDLAMGSKVAIFLLYQPKSVPRSVFLTLDYLISHGYAPLIVVNGGAAAQDVPALRRSAWLLVQRPNFGYDFGGYRDGLKVLRARGTDPDRLIVMNDSVWLPINGDPIRQLEQHLDTNDLDAAGLNQDEKVRYQPDGSVRFELRQIESYFYLFSAGFWKSDVFKQFWDQYRMSSDKKYTIKHGEIGFSKYMMDRGRRFSGLMRRSVFLDRIESCAPDFLHKTLTYAAYADAKYARERDELLASYDGSDAWRDAALSHIRANALRRPFNTSFCFAADQLFGTTYLKKNSQTYFHDMRAQYLRAVEDGGVTPPAPDILLEIKALVANHDPKTAERTL